MRRDGKELSKTDKLQRQYDLAVVELLREHNIRDYDNVEVEEQPIYEGDNVKEVRYLLKYLGRKLGYINFSLTPLEKNEVEK